jgi:hypothetical protein
MIAYEAEGAMILTVSPAFSFPGIIRGSFDIYSGGREYRLPGVNNKMGGRKVPVVVFNEANYGIKTKTPEERSLRRPLQIGDSSDVLTLRSKNVDTEAIQDMEIDSLMSRIRKSVDEIAEEGMDGRQRRKHFVEKAMRLAGVEKKSTHGFKVSMGMLKKQRERAKKQEQMIRETDTVIAKEQRLIRKLQSRKVQRKSQK